MKVKLVERITHKKLKNLNIIFRRHISDWGTPYFEISSPCDEVGYLRIAFYSNEVILYSKISHSHINAFEFNRTNRRRKYSNLASKKAVAKTAAKSIRKIVNGLIYMSEDFDENGNSLSSGSGPIEFSCSRNPQKADEMSRIHRVPVITKEWNWFGAL
jgi:hypothetical protein